MEEWRQVVGYEGVYEVSSLGNVRRGGRMKQQTVAANGYLVVGLWANGKGRVCYIHDLVARAFIGEKGAGMSVNHMDGKKRNNKPENLEYLSLSSNAQHAWVNGLCNSRGENSAAAKLTEEQAKEIRRRAIAGERTCDLAAEFGVGSPIISQIKHGTRWRHQLEPESRA